MLQKLSLFSRILIAAIGLMLIPVYFFPLWSIRLIAPQYPEGLGMFLWVQKITGQTEFDLQNINLLNHYIGMAPIVEQSIPEFQYMPYVLAFMIFGAFFTVFYPRRMMAYLGFINFFLVGIAGLYDFWRWEYNYGHHLNPNAPISVPGMIYQPPLLGCKQLLNIKACSLPQIGGGLLILAAAFLFFVILLESSKKIRNLISKWIPFVLLLSCSRGQPVDFKAGEFACDYCKMNIVNMPFKAEAVTKKGKVYHFDSIECLTNWRKIHTEDLKKTWVTDFFHPLSWLEVEKAFFLKSDRLASPMGANLSAFQNEQDFRLAQSRFGGTQVLPQNLQNAIGGAE